MRPPEAAAPCSWGCGRPASTERPSGQFLGLSGPLTLCDECAGAYDLGAKMLEAGIIGQNDVGAFVRGFKTLARHSGLQREGTQ